MAFEKICQGRLEKVGWRNLDDTKPVSTFHPPKPHQPRHIRMPVITLELVILNRGETNLNRKADRLKSGKGPGSEPITNSFVYHYLGKISPESL